MFVCFVKEAKVQHDSTTEIYKADSVYLTTLDLNGDIFKSTSATRALEKLKYLSVDHIQEDMHPLGFTANMQSYSADYPIYSDILRCT